MPADATLDRLDRPTRDVGPRSLKEQPIPWLESAGYLEVLSLSAAVAAPCCQYGALLSFQHSPRPCRLSIRGVHHPTLLETWSQQGLVVNALRTRGREPLRSVSRLLGFMTDSYIGDPSRRLVAGPNCGPRCLRDPLGCFTTPGSFGGWHHVGGPYQVSNAWRLLCLAVALTEDRGGYPTLLEICRHHYQQHWLNRHFTLEVALKMYSRPSFRLRSFQEFGNPRQLVLRRGCG